MAKTPKTTLQKPPKHPIYEVFGYPFHDESEEAQKARREKLCPFQTPDTKCRKVSISNPLGVCSVADGTSHAITCPTRFKENWVIEEHAASFFFPKDAVVKRLPEIRIKTKSGDSAGNIDVVLVHTNPDDPKEILDFGSVEIQAVYISGNVRVPFEEYMSNREKYITDGFKGKNSPRPDYLSSSRKRLAPQMVMKGGMFKKWGKRQAIVLHRGFFETLPHLTVVEKDSAEVAWLIYELKKHATENRMVLTLHKAIYTMFDSALAAISTADCEEEPVKFKQALLKKL